MTSYPTLLDLQASVQDASAFGQIEDYQTLTGRSLKKLSKNQIRQIHDQKVKGNNSVVTKPCQLSQIVASISTFPITYKQQAHFTPG